MKLNESQINKVAVLGLGITGASFVRYCLKKDWQVVIFDSRRTPPKLNEFKAEFPPVSIQLGAFKKDAFRDFDLILASPGIDLSQPELASAVRDYQLEVSGDIELFATHCRQPIIAVTGSNGKSTVCDCLGWTLEQLGISNVVAGNIGKPVLDLIDTEQPQVYVLELSSFQLELIKQFKAKVVSVLNISEDHLDRHNNLETYSSIKRRLYQWGESAAVNLDDPLTHDSQIPVNQRTYGLSDNSDYKVIQTDSGYVVEKLGEYLVEEKHALLKGLHNGLNFAACLAILDLYGVDINPQLTEHLHRYSGLPHRCQIIPSSDGLTWINDSKATNCGAAVSAIKGFSKKAGNLFLIAGGDAKNADLSELGVAIDHYVQHCFVFGKDADAVKAVSPLDRCHKVDDLNHAVQQVKALASSGDCVLFSPACASLDMYDNYIKRGEHFIQLVEALS